MDRNFNDTVDSYLHEIQDLKNLVEKKEADILALKKEYLNQAQQNETLMRREQGIIDEINQVKIRVEEIEREKELQLATRDEKQRNQLDTIRKVHTAELENLRAENNELELLLRDRLEENERLKGEGRNLVDNLQAVKASESRMFGEVEQLKNKAVEVEYFKNKEVAGHEDLRRSHTIANSKQHQNEVAALQNSLLQLRMKCDAKAKEAEEWRRNFYNVREGRPYGN
jgi:chromosome segregation ATPase